MDLGSIFLALALSILVVWVIVRPFVSSGEIAAQRLEDEFGQQRSVLLAERDRILNALQELDFDHSLGKIPEGEYPLRRLTLVRKGAEVLRQLDNLTNDNAGVLGTPPGYLKELSAERADFEDSSGKIVSQVPQDSHIPSVSTPLAVDDELETMLASRRRARLDKAGGFCCRCGGALQKSDRFCPKCGEKVK